MLRKRSRRYQLLLAAMLIGTSCERASEQMADRWMSDVHYWRIAPPINPTRSRATKVEVIEFFWYGCPHCYVLEPYLVLWERHSKPAYVTLRRVPAAWRTEVRAHARLYYTLSALGREDLHGAVFDAVHRNGQRLFSPMEDETTRAHIALASTLSIAPDVFLEAYNSPAVLAAVKQAERLAQQYRVDHVPVVVIDSTYVSDLERVNGNAKALLDVTDYLAQRAHTTGSNR